MKRYLKNQKLITDFFLKERFDNTQVVLRADNYISAFQALNL